MSTPRTELRYRIHDAIDAYLEVYPDQVDLYDPDTVKELSRWIRDSLQAWRP